MVPYTDINAEAALPDAFAQHGLVWAKYLVAIGALSGMTTSLVMNNFLLSFTGGVNTEPSADPEATRQNA